MGAQNGKIVVTEEQFENFSKTSGMAKERVVKHCQEFLKNHPKGRMNRKEFITFTNMALKNTRKIDIKSMAEHIFRMYDTDQDDHITFIEFMVIYNIMINGNAEENLKKIFLIFDINRDGVIAPEEMTILVKDISILVDGEEDSTKPASKVFNEMDKDNNGKITSEEFRAAILAQEKFSKFLALKVIDIFV